MNAGANHANRNSPAAQIRSVPPFAIVTESGQQMVVRHPENVAYDPAAETANCYLLADGVMHIVPWEDIASVTMADRGQPLPSQ